MPRYFFHVFNDETCLDEEGQELADLDAARGRAVREARALMGDGLQKGEIVLSHHIAIQDEHGTMLLDVKFAEAVQIRP